jgi:hypothetical protein
LVGFLFLFLCADPFPFAPEQLISLGAWSKNRVPVLAGQTLEAPKLPSKECYHRAVVLPLGARSANT